ncbi:hypothetical protein V7S43_015014 [Phytophthora oleae]|uniref:Uncharacterized protein n=1 Tax=Phytophthora oleae TaxID=2107226 RepID=A0ABD3F015_9STRA
MELSEDVYEDELIDAFDAPESEVLAPLKAPTASPPCKSLLPTRPVPEFPPKKNIPGLYPTFEDTSAATVARGVPLTTVTQRENVKRNEQREDVPVKVYDREELMSEEELQRKQQQIEHEMRVYQERFDHVAQALAGETPHQIQERKRHEEERLQRQEKRYEAMETRLQHQVKRLEEREERRARIQARHHRASRSPSLSRNSEEDQDEQTVVKTYIHSHEGDRAVS